MPRPLPEPTTIRLALLVLIAGACSQAWPHEYWIDRDGRRYTLHQGHKTAAHAGPATLAIDPAIIAEVACTDRSAKTVQLRHHGNPPSVEAECARISFRLSSGYWTKTAYETVNKPRNEVKGAINSWLSQETVTRIEQWSPGLAKSVPPGLALTLAADPAGLGTGDKFTLRALIDGKPAADVPVAYDGETRGTTDTEGRVNLRIRHGGLQQVSASIETPNGDGKADTLIRGATLNFVLP